MSSLIVSLIFLILLHGIQGKIDDFRNYTVYEVTAFNNRERAILYTLHVRVDDMIFVNGITNEAALPMDVLVNKCSTNEFETVLSSNDIEYLKINNPSIINKQPYTDSHSNPHEEPNLTGKFHCYDTLRQWVKLKIKKTTYLEEIKIGQSYEKRDIFVLKFSNGKKKKAVFLMGGEQGRDWSSPAILLNLINFIIDKKHDLNILTRHYEFYILPLFNPDGYMYSMNKDRLWSKNTRVYFPKKPCPDNASAVGISVDRNWYFNKLTVRNEECDPIFTGSKPLSEEETIATSQFLNKIALKMMAFINIRGFENLVTIPYGYDKKYCNNYDVLVEMLSAVHDAVSKRINSTFNYGLAAKNMYNNSGNVADWVKHHLNTPVVYTFYMKTGRYILPSAQDVQPLTDQLSTMMKEVLLLANSFYGPLFNNQLEYSINIPLLLVSVLSLKIINSYSY